MSVESGEWVLHGLSADDPNCIKSCGELVEYVNEIGFLPLFKNKIEDFSVEEHTCADFWWTGVIECDPWEWRQIIARSGEVAYGKFFDKKSGFISKKWFPEFANYRRNGYDFDSRWEDGLATLRSKKIMDQFEDNDELFSMHLKKMAGFGKDGEKNFDGVVTELQHQTYVIMRDFRRRLNKQGLEYGWAASVYSTPEHLWGCEYVASGYSEPPESSMHRIIENVRLHFPNATDDQIKRIIL